MNDSIKFPYGAIKRVDTDRRRASHLGRREEPGGLGRLSDGPASVAQEDGSGSRRMWLPSGRALARSGPGT